MYKASPRLSQIKKMQEVKHNSLTFCSWNMIQVSGSHAQNQSYIYDFL